VGRSPRVPVRGDRSQPRVYLNCSSAVRSCPTVRGERSRSLAPSRSASEMSAMNMACTWGTSMGKVTIRLPPGSGLSGNRITRCFCSLTQHRSLITLSSTRRTPCHDLIHSRTLRISSAGTAFRASSQRTRLNVPKSSSPSKATLSKSEGDSDSRRYESIVGTKRCNKSRWGLPRSELASVVSTTLLTSVRF
jgi:hypothetical protein